MVYSRQAMRKYGYTRDNDMIAMDCRTAQALWEDFLPNIYILFSDGTDKLIEYETDFEQHCDKMFGILACQAFPRETQVLTKFAQRGCEDGLLADATDGFWFYGYRLCRF